jgi:uroporphyrinogen-III decarboxylase
MISTDWAIDIATAQYNLRSETPNSGHIDPVILRVINQQQTEAAVRECIDKADQRDKP